MLEREQRGLISALLYPVIFEDDAVDGIDRVLDVVVGRRALGATPQEYLAAVRAALASGDALAELIPQPHSDAEVRRFLAALEPRLQTLT